MGVENISSEQIIFSGIIDPECESHRDRRKNLITLFNDDTVFKNEYYVIYKVIKDNSPNIKVDEKFISRYMSFNRADLLNSGCIDIGGYGSDDAYAEFVKTTCDMLKELKEIKPTEQDFETALEDYRMTYITDRTVSALEESAMILTDGKRVGRTMYTGYDGVKHFMSQQFSKLDNIVEKSDRKGVIIYGQNEEDEEEVAPSKLVTTFGIEKLDENIGGLYEGDMLSLLAPPKGGKSRFATYVIHNALVNHKCNCVMWSLENGVAGWECLIRARHFEYKYNSDVTDIGSKNLIDDDMIKKDRLPAKIKEMEKASWIDLKHNEEYGRLASIDDEFNVDTFLEILDEAVNAIDAKLVCIDYLQLITGDKYGSKNERIGMAYQKTLRYLKKKKIAGIFPAQFKQVSVTGLSKNSEDIGTMEMRDSGAESAEVIRTPDINLGLYATEEELKEGYVKCVPIPSRTVKPFDPFDMIVDFGTSTYRSIDGRG